MWISRRGGIAGERHGVAGMGRVTIGGKQPAVQTEGELRKTTVLSPAGYYWAPSAGDEAMVLQAGDLGEDACLVGLKQNCPFDLRPGEIAIGTPDSYIHSAPGGITLCGKVYVSGTLDVKGKLVVDGEVSASDLVHLNGAVYINHIFQVGD